MRNSKQDATRSQRINAIRAAAGNTMAQCPTCGRAKGAPYRAQVAGKLAYGCVDAFHAGALYGASLEWHMREEAQALRLATYHTLVAL